VPTRKRSLNVGPFFNGENRAMIQRVVDDVQLLEKSEKFGASGRVRGSSSHAPAVTYRT
jgi:hypothetical protein